MSVFDLVESKDQLRSANGGASNSRWERVPCIRGVSGADFPRGVQTFRFSTSGPGWWMPSKSYFRIRASLTKANGDALLLADNIAPAMAFGSCLYQRAEYVAMNQKVCTADRFLPQVDAISTRVSKSKAWLDSIGASTNLWQSSFAERQNLVCKDGRGAMRSMSLQSASRQDLGYDASAANNANSIAITAAGVVTFAVNGGAALPDATTIYAVGGYLQLSAGAYSPLRTAHMRIISVDSATQITVLPPGDFTDFAAASTAVWYYIPPGGESALAAGQFEVVWVPPLGIFNVEHAIPAGSHEINLQPETAANYKQAAIQSILATKTAGVDFELSIDDVQFYAHVLDGPRVDNASYLLDFEEITAQSLTLQSPNYLGLEFGVPPSTRALTVAYQQTNAGPNNTLIPYSLLRLAGGLERTLSRFTVSYANVTKPSPDADPAQADGAGNAPNQLQLTNLWHNGILYSGGYVDDGGAEGLQEWIERGLFAHQEWPKDGADASTRCTVYSQFSGAIAAQSAQVFLFAHSSKAVEMSIQDGQIVRVHPHAQ